MRRRRAGILIAFLVVAAAIQGASAQRTRGPMRVVVLIDSSEGMQTMLTEFRMGLNTLVDILPDDVEVTFISTGGQLRVRVPPTTNHELMRKAANGFHPDGGPNSLLETMIESDERFLRTVPDMRAVIIILTSDSGSQWGTQRVGAYNVFLHQFADRRGRAHGIVIRGLHTGVTTEITANLTENTGGYFDTISVATALSKQIKLLGEQFAADY